MSLSQINIEVQYQAYLQRVGLTEEMMKPIQKQETRRAFFAGFVQALVLMRDDIGALPEMVAVSLLEKLLNEGLQFWEKEAREHKKNNPYPAPEKKASSIIQPKNPRMN